MHLSWHIGSFIIHHHKRMGVVSGANCASDIHSHVILKSLASGRLLEWPKKIKTAGQCVCAKGRVQVIYTTILWVRAAVWGRVSRSHFSYPPDTSSLAINKFNLVQKVAGHFDGAVFVQKINTKMPCQWKNNCKHLVRWQPCLVIFEFFTAFHELQMTGKCTRTLR